MYIQKIKRKCDVRGCRCTDSYSISNTREHGNTVIICEGCLRSALSAIKENNIKGKVEDNHSSEAPPLFFSDKLNAQGEAFTCSKCGKIFANKRGLEAHLKSCSSINTKNSKGADLNESDKKEKKD